MRLAGKTALITAAAAGIGRATASFFLREGADVIATDIRADGLAELRTAHSMIRTEVLNVSDAAAIEDLRGRIENIDVLVNVAGVVCNGSILQCSEADWASSLDINLSSTYRMIRTWLPAMIARGGGSIINIASVASSIKGVPSRFAYSTTKAGVIGLTKSIAADFVTAGIRCNVICPGTIDTPSLTQRLRDAGDEAKTRVAFVARQPMGRLGTAEEVAALCTYLASDESAFTTGAVHVIDGGWTM